MVEISIISQKPKIGKLFFHRLQNIAHHLGQKKLAIFGYILVNFQRFISIKSTISQKLDITSSFTMWASISFRTLHSLMEQKPHMATFACRQWHKVNYLKGLWRSFCKSYSSCNKFEWKRKQIYIYIYIRTLFKVSKQINEIKIVYMIKKIILWIIEIYLELVPEFHINKITFMFKNSFCELIFALYYFDSLYRLNEFLILLVNWSYDMIIFTICFGNKWIQFGWKYEI